MEEIEIKYEFDEYYNIQCRTCLSIGRKLFPVGKYLPLFRMLTSGCEFKELVLDEKLQICWECLAVLRRISLFREQAQSTDQLLQSRQSYSTLSTLAIVTINDSHPNTVYFNDQAADTFKGKPIKEIKDLIKFNDDDNNKHSKSDDENLTFSNGCFEIPNLLLDTHVEKQSETHIEINKSILLGKSKNRNVDNKWAKKRALQNKKPKYELLDGIDCDKVFQQLWIDFEELKQSIQSNRNSCSQVRCYKCKKCALSLKEDNWVVHNKSCNKSSLHACDLCGKIFADKGLLVKHINGHYRKYECLLCKFSCYNRKRRKKHVEEYHKQIYKCIKCKSIFKCRRDFFKHYQEWHEKYVCDHCGVSFKMKYSIKDHIRKQHSPIECKICNKKFSRYNGLWLHNKVKHSPGQQAAYCVECDKRYPDVYRYRWHLANSTRHKPRKKVRIPCPGCEKVFSKKIYMTDHYNLVHLKNYKYRCEQCDKNFIRNADLMKHKRRVHEGILPLKNKICYVCGRGFSTNKILTNHLRTHSGERPFPCEHCPARFAQSAALTGHVRKVHRHLNPSHLT